MPSFEERENTFENKFVHDEQIEFRAHARRNKLLGLWAASLMGLDDANAQVYAKEVVKADFEEVGDDDVFRKIRTDFDNCGVEQSDTSIRQMMGQLLHEARNQVRSEV